MTDQPQATPPAQEISQEFFIRVNDFIEMANRIERRFDTHHAQIAMLHAFARYSAHHYRVVEKEDSADKRTQYADYVASLVRNFTEHYTGDILGPAPGTAAPSDTSAE
jgi:Protein of unknown function (DUF3144)